MFPKYGVGRFILGFTAILATAIVVVVSAVHWANDVRCTSRWSGTAHSEYKAYSGCRVLVFGKFIPENQIIIPLPPPRPTSQQSQVPKVPEQSA